MPEDKENPSPSAIVCAEIQEIAQRKREMGDEGTPGGLEHMGDVWRLLAGWDLLLTAEKGGE